MFPIASNILSLSPQMVLLCGEVKLVPGGTFLANYITIDSFLNEKVSGTSSLLPTTYMWFKMWALSFLLSVCSTLTGMLPPPIWTLAHRNQSQINSFILSLSCS